MHLQSKLLSDHKHPTGRVAGPSCTWYVCWADEPCFWASWWALSSRLTRRGIAPASLRGVWFSWHRARLRIRPTTAFRRGGEAQLIIIIILFTLISQLSTGHCVLKYDPMSCFLSKTLHAVTLSGVSLSRPIAQTARLALCSIILPLHLCSPLLCIYPKHTLFTKPLTSSLCLLRNPVWGFCQFSPKIL